MQHHQGAHADVAIGIDEESGRFRVARSTYTDPALHAAEMEAIFAKCWLFVGHDSELPKSNDFATRKVAGRPVSFLRDREGTVRCLLNVCRQAFFVPVSRLGFREHRTRHQHRGRRDLPPKIQRARV